jgi:hypothetical protein
MDPKKKAELDAYFAQAKTPRAASVLGAPSMGNPSLDPEESKGMDPGLVDPIEIVQQIAAFAATPGGGIAKNAPWLIRQSLRGAVGFAGGGAINDLTDLKNPLPNMPGNAAMGAIAGPILAKPLEMLGGKFSEVVRNRAKQATIVQRLFEQKSLRTAAMPSGKIVSVVDRVLQAIEDAPHLQKEQDELTRMGRSGAFRAGRAIAETTQGLSGLRAEGAAISGKLPKVSPNAIKPIVSAEDTTQLLEMIKRMDPNSMSYIEGFRARSALADLLQGKRLPAPSELELLSRVFGDKFVTTLRKKGPQIGLLRKYGYEVANLPRELMASVDLSAPLRQGLLLISHPKEFSAAFGSMFKYFASEDAYQALRQDIMSNKHAGLGRKFGLSLSDSGSNLLQREEAFQSNLGERIPVLGRVVRASNRAYTGFLNKLRMDTFSSLVDDAIRLSENDKLMGQFKVSQGDARAAAGYFAQAKDLNPYRNKKLASDLAKYVNVSTGRGGGKFISEHGAMLNSIFFSPRLIASRLTALNPMYYAKLHPYARRQAVRSMLILGSGVLTTAAAAKAAGADVEIDPNSPDFLKIKIGNTRYDIMGGFQQYIRLGALLTKEVYDRSRGDDSNDVTTAIARFARTKESPLASMLHDYLAGIDTIGRPFTLNMDEGWSGNAITRRLTPMFIQDVIDVSKEWGPAKGIPMAIPGAFGVGIQDYD